MSALNEDYAELRNNFANKRVMQLTLRVMHDIYTNPKFWIGFGAVLLLLATTGPFGTLDSMDFAHRLFYWSVISFSTFFIGCIFSVLIGSILFGKGVAEWLSWIIAGTICGLPNGSLVWMMNSRVFNMDIAALYSFPQFIAFSSMISVAIVILIFLVSRQPQAETSPIVKATPNPFLARLPKHLGNQLISLEAQDHYINVRTEKGNDLILMRLGDAEKELKGFSGQRVHRSWWVASEAIDKIIRKNGKMELKLTDGSIIPVSRSYAKTIAKLGVVNF